MPYLARHHIFRSLGRSSVAVGGHLETEEDQEVEVLVEGSHLRSAAEPLTAYRMIPWFHDYFSPIIDTGGPVIILRFCDWDTFDKLLFKDEGRSDMG